MSLKKLIVLAILALAAYYAIHVKGFNPFSHKIDGNVTLYSMDGKTPSLSEVAGENGTFIFFMGTWCPVCVSEIETLKGLTEFFRKNKINILLCIHGESKDNIHQWTYQRDIPWDWKTFYWYNTYEPAFNIDVKGVPYLLVRNKNGKATFKKAGGSRHAQKQQVMRLFQTLCLEQRLKPESNNSVQVILAITKRVVQVYAPVATVLRKGNAVILFPFPAVFRFKTPV